MSNLTRTASQLPSKDELEKQRLPLQLTLLEQQVCVGQMPHTWSVLAAGDVDSSNRDFIEILNELRVFVQQNGLNLTEYEDDVQYYLERLRGSGAAAYNKFLPENAQKQISRIEVEQAQKQGLSLNFLEMSASPRSFLWEMLYAGDPLEEVDPMQFWGFSYRLGRTYLGFDFNAIFRLGDGIFSVIHDELESSKEEVDRLKEQIREICERLRLEKVTLECLDDCLNPESVSTDQFIKLLIGDHFNYGLVHFACHCENPENTGPDKAYLRLTAHGKPLEISLQKLIALKGRHQFVNRPFFFLNACESATPAHVMHKVNFPTGFLGMKASGVIATACTMPDKFAGAFATEFYRRLFNKPSLSNLIYIGEALLETRLHFLNEYNNPLGLAYGLYALSDQQIQLG